MKYEVNEGGNGGAMRLLNKTEKKEERKISTEVSISTAQIK
jgi:hypothetical protein